ncbi:hypothetical protein AAG906_031277 [Vitis piasezkii]
MAVGEIFLSAAFQITLEKLASPMSKELEKRFGDLKKLTRTLSKIQAVLSDAEARQITNAAVKLWLGDVEEVAYDAEDVLEEINERLDEIEKERDGLGLREISGEKRNNKRPQSSSLVEESRVLGREVEKEEILELLVSDEYGGSDVCVIPIVGMGGLGKTTLAQLVYNDEKVTKHFELKMWSYKISPRFCYRENFDLMDLDILQSKLRDILKGKRYLLVLDDVWTEKKSDWDRLRLPLRAGATGNDDCWSLFKQIAFENRNADAHPELVRIGKEILKKCRGLPLAVKTIGGLLYLETEEYEWEMILKSDLWDFEEDENGILPALRLSYNHLPEHLKQCFVFCSVFPKDYNFEKETLVLLWIAEGFVLAKGRKHLEDLGSDYFDELLLRSFFQRSKINSSKFFVMHDLVHDLAQYLAGDLCFRLEEGNSQSISERARHAAVLHNTFKSGVTFEALGTTTNLRTVILLHGNERSETPKAIVLHDLLPSLRCLRVLDLSHIAVEEIPDMVGRLKHLSLHLYNLQSLILMNCNNLKGFVVAKEKGCGIGELKGMTELEEANLKNKQYLRRLELKWSPGHHMPHAIGEELLECLEPHGNLKELKIDVYHGAKFPNWMGYSLLSRLERIELSQCTYSRILPPLGQLPLLNCEFCGEGQIRGFPSLEKMKLEDMKNLKEWHEIEDVQFLSSLSSLKISISRLALLPEGLLQHLNSLKELRIQNFTGSRVSQRFEILSCPKLVSLPEEGLSSALRYLSLCVCNSLQSLPKGLENLSSLEELSISKCPKLVTFPEEKLPSSLKLLRISACANLVSLPKRLNELSVLQHLAIDSCHALRSLPEEGLPASVRSLSIQRSQLLEKRCEEGGEDWNKIAHIPDRYIKRF